MDQLIYKVAQKRHALYFGPTATRKPSWKLAMLLCDRLGHCQRKALGKTPMFARGR